MIHIEHNCPNCPFFGHSSKRHEKLGVIKMGGPLLGMPISISEWVANYLGQYPFIKAGLKEGIINYSALARKIAPDIEKEIGKPANVDSIMVAIRRYGERNHLIEQDPELRALFKRGSITIQDGISFAMFDNIQDVEAEIFHALEKESWASTEFRIILGSPSHITTILRHNKMKTVLEKIPQRTHLQVEHGFSIITIKLPLEAFKAANLISELSSEVGKVGIAHMIFGAPPEVHFLVSGKNSATAYSEFKKIVGQTVSEDASDFL